MEEAISGITYSYAAKLKGIDTCTHISHLKKKAALEWSSQPTANLKLKISKQPKTTTRIIIPVSKQIAPDVDGSPKTPNQASHT